MNQPANDDLWDVLERTLEPFLDQWQRWEEDRHSEASDVPSIEPVLENTPQHLRKDVLLELVKLDMEQRLERELDGWQYEDYAARFELLRERETALGLILEEWRLRRAAQHELVPEQYETRFPEWAEELRGKLRPSRNRVAEAIEPQVSVGNVPPPGARSHASGRVTPITSPHFGTSTAEPGQTVGEFQLIRLLGEGSFARVFLAYQTSMNRFVALKISDDQNSEPRILAQLDHPYIVRVFDQRSEPQTGQGLLYMEYVPAGTLADVATRAKKMPADELSGSFFLDCLSAALSDGKPVELSETTKYYFRDKSWEQVVCDLGVKIAWALEHAHQQQIVHRDLKPANVLLTADGTPKLADFNIGTQNLAVDLNQEVSAEESLGGTLAYMSPEQLEACNPGHPRKASELDGRTDIYALGVVLWELLYGEHPFPFEVDANVSEAFNRLAVQRRTSSPHPLKPNERSGDSKMHDPLRRVLLRCLEPDLPRRCSSGADVAQSLQLCQEPRTVQLLHYGEHPWRKFVARWPLLSLLLFALIPHAMAGVFNFFYNYTAIVEHLADSQEVFWNVQAVINSIAFPVGLLILGAAAWPVASAMRVKAESPEAGQLATTRQRALRLGHITALVGLSEWLIAGLAYPVSLQIVAGGLTLGDYLHFAASLILCGLIAAAYPFFFLTVIATRVLYPALAERSESRELAADGPELTRLLNQQNIYLLLAGGVPGLAMFALLITGLFTPGEHTFALIVLSLLGAIGFAAIFGLFRLLQLDIAALKYIVEVMGRRQ